jgi:hypothetical protein
LWEHGKRVRWFDEKEVALINQKQLNINSYFVEEHSDKGLKPNALFSKPANFDTSMAQVKQKLNIKFI